MEIVTGAKTLPVQKRISVRTAVDVAQVFWPDFIESNGCIFAAFQFKGGDLTESSDGKTGLECFVNHTHLLDEFRNKATLEARTRHSEQLDVIEETYDERHPDFILACN